VSQVIGPFDLVQDVQRSIGHSGIAETLPPVLFFQVSTFLRAQFEPVQHLLQDISTLPQQLGLLARVD
jgi:hypothetical protein